MTAQKGAGDADTNKAPAEKKALAAGPSYNVHESSLVCPCCSGSDNFKKGPDWATLEPNADVWHTVLKNIGCDESSIHQFFLLSQLVGGNSECNHIVETLCRKGNEIRKKSAFLAVSCQRVRHRLFSNNDCEGNIYLTDIDVGEV